MRRMRLRTLMIAIAVLALILGVDAWLRQRGRRFDAIALNFAGEAYRVEKLWAKSTLPGEIDELVETVHWNDSVYHEYYKAARRPWLPEPRPKEVVCRCGYHVAN